MKISARNQFKGKVKSVTKGAVNCEVTIEIPGGHEIVSIVTKEAIKNLGLKKGKTAYAIVKSSSVLIGVE